mmetsp:Transcript_62652/g.204484  ORF Transcript_62652/g.204484 Transcript_62652/m.204484 type:complete len:394 (-) Transcript_62652:161-1342(-)
MRTRPRRGPMHRSVPKGSPPQPGNQDSGLTLPATTPAWRRVTLRSRATRSCSRRTRSRSISRCSSSSSPSPSPTRPSCAPLRRTACLGRSTSRRASSPSTTAQDTSPVLGRSASANASALSTATPGRGCPSTRTARVPWAACSRPWPRSRWIARTRSASWRPPTPWKTPPTVPSRAAGRCPLRRPPRRMHPTTGTVAVANLTTSLLATSSPGLASRTASLLMGSQATASLIDSSVATTSPRLGSRLATASLRMGSRLATASLRTSSSLATASPHTGSSLGTMEALATTTTSSSSSISSNSSSTRTRATRRCSGSSGRRNREEAAAWASSRWRLAAASPPAPGGCSLRATSTTSATPWAARRASWATASRMLADSLGMVSGRWRTPLKMTSSSM